MSSIPSVLFCFYILTIVITTTTARTPLPPPPTIQPSRMQFFSKVHLHPAVHGCPWLSFWLHPTSSQLSLICIHVIFRSPSDFLRPPPPPPRPQRRPGRPDVSLLSAISGLSFDSPFLSPIAVFFSFCLVLFLSCHFSANDPFS